MAQGYASNEHLPADVRKKLPPEAQDVYRTAFNAALAAGKKEPDASQAGWDAVRQGWRQQTSTNAPWEKFEGEKQ